MDSGDMPIDTPKRGIKLREKTINSHFLFPFSLLNLLKLVFIVLFFFAIFSQKLR